MQLQLPVQRAVQYELFQDLEALGGFMSGVGAVCLKAPYLVSPCWFVLQLLGKSERK